MLMPLPSCWRCTQYVRYPLIYTRQPRAQDLGNAGKLAHFRDSLGAFLIQISSDGLDRASAEEPWFIKDWVRCAAVSVTLH